MKECFFSKLGMGTSFIRSLLVGISLLTFSMLCAQQRPPIQEIFIPAGFQETKDVVFFELDKHGSKGTIERVIAHYNKYIVGKEIGIDHPATVKEDLKDHDGKPLNWKLRMDIVHPAKPSEPRPVIVIVATQPVRNMSRYTPFQQNLAKRGYVTVVIDHCYSPLTWAFGYHDAYYSLDEITGVKAYTAAIRYLRANAAQYSIDPERIGGLGHSKGSYAITRLSDPDINEDSDERFGKREPYGPQPYTGYASNIQVGYQSMGNGTRSSKRYVKDNYAPTITAVGKSDQYKHWDAWPTVVEAYSKDHDANWLGIPMLDRGHHMATGFQPDIGYVREEAVEKFFSSYLEPDLPPNILYVTPYNGRDNKNVVSPDQPVIVHFSPQMDVASVKEAVQVVCQQTGKVIEGNWKVKRKDTYFIFTPKKADSFKDRTDYKVVIGSDVKSIRGISLGKTQEHTFSVSGKYPSQ